MSPPNLPPKIPPAPSRPELDEELREYLREQKQADVRGKLDQLKDGLDRFYDLFMRHDAEDKARHQELRGDMRGLSLRVGEVERKIEKHDTRLGHIESRSAKHEQDLDNSRSWVITTLDGQKKIAIEQTTWLKRNAVAIIATLIAIFATVWHLFR